MDPVLQLLSTSTCVKAWACPLEKDLSGDRTGTSTVNSIQGRFDSIQPRILCLSQNIPPYLSHVTAGSVNEHEYGTTSLKNMDLNVTQLSWNQVGSMCY